MANVPDLTMAEIADKVLDVDLKAWLLAADPLPAGVGMAEFYSKTMNAAYVAQTAKNNAANAITPLAPGEALATYNAPGFGQVSTSVEDGIQTFPAIYTVSTVSTTDLNLTVPSRA